MSGRLKLLSLLCPTLLGSLSSAATQRQPAAPVFGTYELTIFERSTMTGATVISHFLLVLSDTRIPAAILNRLASTDPVYSKLDPKQYRPTGRERACWRPVTEASASAPAGTRTNWTLIGDTVEVVQWFSVDAGTTFWFRTDSAGLRGVAMSTGWMPSPPDGRNKPMNLRDSLIGIRVSKPDPIRCVNG